MLTDQQEIRSCVVKGVNVQGEDLCVSPYMLCMTAFAFSRLEAPMITLTGFYIRRNRFVAVEAKSRLRVAVEPNVTFFTLLFEFGVLENHVAGHDRQLNFPRMGRNSVHTDN